METDSLNGKIRSIENLLQCESIRKLLIRLQATVYQPSNATPQGIIQEILSNKTNGLPILATDLAAVLDQYLLWKNYLPRVQPFYAIKSSYNPGLVELLALMGCGFDVASPYEMELVLKLGAEPERLIYANLFKQPDYIQYARDQKVSLMTFDNEDELLKIKKVHPESRLILRIQTVNPDVKKRFGCKIEDAQGILEVARKAGSNVVGVSFHAGYRCPDPSYFRKSLRNAKKVFNIGEDLGMKFDTIDIGGGFGGYVGDTVFTFEELSAVINQSLDEYFGDYSDINYIAEPGRYFSARSLTVATQVIGRKRINMNRKTHYEYTINDGTHGVFNCIIRWGGLPNIGFIRNVDFKTTYQSALYGPTCDAGDLVNDNMNLPLLEIGDWLYFEKWGAYTDALCTNFNGFLNYDQRYIFLEDSLTR